jgi:hypothetical protein
MKFSYSELCELIAFEGVYQVLANQMLAFRVMMSREQFLSMSFPVLVDCDDLFELAKRGKPINLVMATQRPSNGSPVKRVVQ